MKKHAWVDGHCVRIREKNGRVHRIKLRYIDDVILTNNKLVIKCWAITKDCVIERSGDYVRKLQKEIVDAIIKMYTKINEGLSKE